MEANTEKHPNHEQHILWAREISAVDNLSMWEANLRARTDIPREDKKQVWKILTTAARKIRADLDNEHHLTTPKPPKARG